MNVDQETLGLRRSGFSPDLSLLMPTFSLPAAPPHLAVRLHSRLECSPTFFYRNDRRTTASAAGFMPVYYPRPIAKPVSCYALFKGWLLLSQPPGYLSERTTFCQLSLHLGALAGGLGCSPLGTGP